MTNLDPEILHGLATQVAECKAAYQQALADREKAREASNRADGVIATAMSNLARAERALADLTDPA